MVIDTTSREGMESSLAHLMDVSVPELYQYIEAAADSAMGHSNISTTLNLYIHPNYEQKKRCIDKMFRSIKKS